MTSIKESKRKKADPVYQKAMKLEKLNVAGLEGRLAGVLEPEGYVRLSFGEPVIDRFIIVPLSVQDADASRSEYDSVRIVKRILRTSLEMTNWRLMSKGVNYRLGYLSFRLKAYEQEADLVKLVKG